MEVGGREGAFCILERRGGGGGLKGLGSSKSLDGGDLQKHCTYDV